MNCTDKIVHSSYYQNQKKNRNPLIFTFVLSSQTFEVDDFWTCNITLLFTIKEAFPLSGHCIMECTGVGLPQSGIKIFGSQLHTHLTGTKVVTRHVRNGEELPLLNYDNHYSTHFQEIRLLPEHVTILPVNLFFNFIFY